MLSKHINYLVTSFVITRSCQEARLEVKNGETGLDDDSFAVGIHNTVEILIMHNLIMHILNNALTLASEL